jgi:hypothetical protein
VILAAAAVLTTGRRPGGLLKFEQMNREPASF